MAQSDRDSGTFHDAIGCSVQEEKHFDVSDARSTVVSKKNVVQAIEITTAKSIKEEFAIAVSQDMTTFEYNMEHKHRGVAVIFNHRVYNDASLEERVGTEKDVDALLECLPMLGFESNNIIVENNLSKSEILNYSYKLSYTKQEVLENCDCLAIFILSHGSKNNTIYARDGDYDLYRLVEQYTPNIYKQLAAKPKLFFIQACRGENVDSGFHAKFERRRASHIVQDKIDIVPVKEMVSHPVHADILISMSSHHEHLSFRNSLGSWYIQDLCNSIRFYHGKNSLDTTDICDIILRAHHFVSLRESSSDDTAYHEKKQIPNFNSAMCRKLFFKKKN